MKFTNKFGITTAASPFNGSTKSNLYCAYTKSPVSRLTNCVVGLNISGFEPLSSKIGMVQLNVSSIVTKASKAFPPNVPTLANLNTSPCKNVLVLPSPLSSVKEPLKSSTV